MSTALSDVTPVTVLNNSSGSSLVYGISHLDIVELTLTAGTGTVSVRTALAESDTFVEDDNLSDAAPHLAFEARSNCIQFVVSAGGPVTVKAQGRRVQKN